MIRRLLAILAGLGLAAAAVYAQKTFTLPFEQLNSSLTTRGAIGQLVSTNRFSVKIESMMLAHAVDTKDFVTGKTAKVESSHLFLVVNLSATTPREPLKLGAFTPPVLLTADGRRYKTTDKVAEELTMFGKWIQPSMWTRGVLVFEVPKDALPGARLVVMPPNSAFVVDNDAPEAEIDLNLSGAAVDRLVSQAAPFHSLADTTR